VKNGEKMSKEIFLKDLGIKIKRLRLLNGWTQKELATRCGYKSRSSNSTINKIESGKTDVSVSKLMIMAELFGVSAAYLLGENEEEANSLAQQNAIQIMDRKLNEEEKDALMRGLKLYFTNKANEEVMT